ncbi:hypothetical protein GCM10027267_05270 [Paramicrobacterium agarici]
MLVKVRVPGRAGRGRANPCAASAMRLAASREIVCDIEMTVSADTDIRAAATYAEPHGAAS